jgi:hypothetical protein
MNPATDKLESVRNNNLQPPMVEIPATRSAAISQLPAGLCDVIGAIGGGNFH